MPPIDDNVLLRFYGHFFGRRQIITLLWCCAIQHFSWRYPIIWHKCIKHCYIVVHTIRRTIFFLPSKGVHSFLNKVRTINNNCLSPKSTSWTLHYTRVRTCWCKLFQGFFLYIKAGSTFFLSRCARHVVVLPYYKVIFQWARLFGSKTLGSILCVLCLRT